MGLVYKSAAQRAATPAVEPAKCPYPTWSYDAAFDPDSEEFFADAVYEAVVNPIQTPPAPLSPIESASASSSDSGRISPDVDSDSLDNDDVPPLVESGRLPGEALRRVQQDVESLTWLARVPTDAHDVPAAPRPAPATVNIQQRARSISDAPSPQSYQRYVAHARGGWLSAVAGRGYALVPPPPARDEPVAPAPAEPERPAWFYTGEYTMQPSTPRRTSDWISQTPDSGMRTPSPPPSVTPHAFTYGRYGLARLPSLADSPTVPRIATTF